MQVIYLSTATSTAIVRVSRDHFRLVWVALSFVTKLPKPFDDPCVIQVVRNSGTIRLAEEEAIKRARDFVRRARSSSQEVGLEQVLRSAVEVEEREIDTAMDEDEMSEDE
jgi:ribonuclease P/MRP protein subunit POP5